MPLRKTTRKKSRRAKPAPLSGLGKAILCAQAALDKKAEEVVALYLGEMSSITDYFIICHGTSGRQVRAIADNVVEKLEKSAAKPLGIEGHTEARWILIDAGDAVVHVFDEPARRFYDLERLWIHAEEIDIEQ